MTLNQKIILSGVLGASFCASATLATVVYRANSADSREYPTNYEMLRDADRKDVLPERYRERMLEAQSRDPSVDFHALMLEAERRGILPEDQRELVLEAERRVTQANRNRARRNAFVLAAMTFAGTFVVTAAVGLALIAMFRILARLALGQRPLGP